MHRVEASDEAAFAKARRVSPAALAVAGILLVALVLRLHDFDVYPANDANWDELDWGWAGLSLWTAHVPTAWSLFQDAYSHAPVGSGYIGDGALPLVRPYLDHPPLFSLVVGAWAWLAGAHSISELRYVSAIRPLAIALSVLTIALTYALGRRLLGTRAALTGAALLAVAPPAVVLGRVVESEQLLTPLWVAALLATHCYLDEGSRRWLALAAGCALLAPLVKLPGVVVALSCAGVLAWRSRWYAAALVGGAGVAAVGLFALYGAAYSWQDFTAVIAANARRKESFASGYVWLTWPTGDNKVVADPWWVLGWIGLGALALDARERPGLLLAWPAAAYLVLMTLLPSIDATSQYGWYRIPVFPLAYLAAGWLTIAALERPSPGTAALLLGLLLAPAVFYLGAPPGHWLPPTVLSVAVAAALAVAVKLRATPALLGVVVAGLALTAAESLTVGPWLGRL